jgi:hypothetical protein
VANPGGEEVMPDELKLEAATTISRQQKMLSLVKPGPGDRTHDGISSEFMREAPNTLGQITRGDQWEPPLGEAPLDESLQEWVCAELEAGTPHRATWEQALAETGRDVAAAKLAYIKLRLKSLFSESRAA